MSQQISSHQVEATIQTMVLSLTKALIFFSLAWFCLTVGVFTVNPVGPIGIFFLCIGILCLAISIVYLIRYRNSSMQARKALERRAAFR